MKKAERARRLLAEFKRFPNIPESVIAIVSSADNGDSNDSRRWVGRAAAACLSQWEKVTSQCSDIPQIMTRVKAKLWTGSIEDEEFVRAVRQFAIARAKSPISIAFYVAPATLSARRFLTWMRIIFLSLRTSLFPNLRKNNSPLFGTSPDACGTTSLERSTSTQHVSSNYRVWNRFRLGGGDACCPHISIHAGHRSKRCPQTLIHRLHKLPPTPQRIPSRIYSRISDRCTS
jgi:hypothetical protein